MNPDTKLAQAYEAPAMRVLGSVAELTQSCDKRLGPPSAADLLSAP